MTSTKSTRTVFDVAPDLCSIKLAFCRPQEDTWFKVLLQHKWHLQALQWSPQRWKIHLSPLQVWQMLSVLVMRLHTVFANIKCTMFWPKGTVWQSLASLYIHVWSNCLRLHDDAPSELQRLAAMLVSTERCGHVLCTTVGSLLMYILEFLTYTGYTKEPWARACQ